MPNRTENILESIKLSTDEETYHALLQRIGSPAEKPSPKQQAMYIQALLDELIQTKGKSIAANVMRPCGGKCISAATIAKAKKLYAKSQNTDDFLSLLNEHRIGGGRLRRENAKIIGIYEKCYCGVAKEAKSLSPVYCNCSAGWYETLFSSVLEKRVIVQIVSTILGGSPVCTFEILTV